VNEKLLADYLVEKLDEHWVNQGNICDIQSAGHLVIVTVGISAYEQETFQIDLLDIIAWVYSKRGKCNCGGKLE